MGCFRVDVPLVIAKENKMPGANPDTYDMHPHLPIQRQWDETLKPRIDELEALVKEHGSHVRMEPSGDIKNEIVELAKENDRLIALNALLKAKVDELEKDREALTECEKGFDAKWYQWSGIIIDQKDKLAQLQEANEKLRGALNNCRLLAARDLKKDPEGYGHILRFCSEAGVTRSILRDL